MSEEELIEILRTFEKNRVEQLEEPARNLFYAIMKIANERDRLNNIINELEKLELYEYTPDYDYDENLVEGYTPFNIKNYTKELKGSDKE